MSNSRIVINVHGGLVQDVFVSDPNTEVTLVDWDTDTCDQADENVFEVFTHSGEKRRAYVADYSTDTIEKLAETDVALALQAAGNPTVCDGCGDGSGLRKNVDPGCRLQMPAGYSVIERCDQCERYPGDLEAAAAVADDPHLVKCQAGHQHAIGQHCVGESMSALQHTVELYPVVRLTVPGIVASSDADAIVLARDKALRELERLLPGKKVEFADEFSHYVVTRPEGSAVLSYYSREQPLISDLCRLVLWGDSEAREPAELERIVDDARHVLHTSI